MVPVLPGVTGKGLAPPRDFRACVKVMVAQQGELMQTESFVLKPGASAAAFLPSAFHRREIVTEQDSGTDEWQQVSVITTDSYNGPLLIPYHHCGTGVSH
jgi:hypothetical protein